MSKGNESWGRFAAKAAMLGAVVLVAAFVGVRLANAGPGVAGGTARTYLTVAGKITGMTGTQRGTFHFQRRGVRTDLCAPQADIAIGAGGEFSVEVPLDDMAFRCPTSMFDGSDVVVTVDLPGRPGIVTEANINPVPYAVYAQQYGTPDCPVGYEREQEAGFPTTNRLCVRRAADGMAIDQVVRVGSGATAFWIDRYEAVVSGSLIALEPVGTMEDNYGTQLQDNGESTTGRPALSTSLPVGSAPSRYITWFQANTACRQAGKRLPTGDEWLMAAQGTPDPPTPNNGNANSMCNTQGSVRYPGRGTACVSAWGAQDMVGNLWEWTAEWFSPGSNIGAAATDGGAGWPAGYNADESENVPGRVLVAAPAVARVGLPAAITRGGSSAGDGYSAGVFAFSAISAPVNSGGTVGFRCVIPR